MHYQQQFEPNESRTTPVIKETGITLVMILKNFADGFSIDGIVQANPEITKDQVLACLHYGSELVEEAYTVRMKNAKKLADNFRKLKDKPNVLKDADGNVIDFS